MAADAQSARFSEILTAIAKQLATVTNLHPSHIKIAASDKYTLPNLDDTWLVVRPYGLEPDTDAGVGRRARRSTRRVRVYIHTRCNLDSYGDDTIALTDTDRHFDLEETVADALDEFWPTNSDDEPLSIEPCHPLDSSSGPPERKPEDEVGVVQSHADFQVVYVPPKSNPQP